MWRFGDSFSINYVGKFKTNILRKRTERRGKANDDDDEKDENDDDEAQR